METFTEDAEQRPDVVPSFDRTVSYFLIAVGVFIGFLLMISTILQVNRVTTKPARLDPIPVRTETPEIGVGSD